jgi:hypothetical protein
MTTNTPPEVLEKQYQRMTSCNKCGGLNEIDRNDFDGTAICEASTKCESCGFTDYWAYGHFESSQDGFNKADRY